MALHQSQQQQCLYGKRFISASVAATATQMLDKVHNCLSRRHCKATAKKSSTQPLPQQLLNQCEMSSASASFTATAKGIHKQFQDRKDGLAQPLLRQLPSRYKENFFSALVPETIKQKLNKMCLKLCHYKVLPNKCEEQLFSVSIPGITQQVQKIFSMSSLRQLQSQCKGKLASTSLTATSKISASNLTAKGVQKKVYFYLSHNNCKSCITQRLSLPQLHQQQHRR